MKLSCFNETNLNLLKDINNAHSDVELKHWNIIYIYVTCLPYLTIIYYRILMIFDK